MRDVRLLTLYKHSYMQYNASNLPSNFYCWGVFDGIDIDLVDTVDCSSSPLSYLHKYINKKNEEIIKGKYTTQNIGLFRCLSSNKADIVFEKFWKSYSINPFFAVAFVQLNNSLKYDKVAKQIENNYTSQNGNLGKQCSVITYTTFNNADLVVLFSSNSINMLAKTLKQISMYHDVRYLYSIAGVSNTYLKECHLNNKVLHEWNGKNCFLNDKINKIELRLTTSGNLQSIAEMIKRIVSIKNYSVTDVSAIERAIITHNLGHNDYKITISKTNVECLIYVALINDYEISKEKNIIENIYNVETFFELTSYRFKKIEGYFNNIECNMESSNEKELLWSNKLIEKYKKRITKKDSNERLSNYYYAIIQTLNTLAQYEFSDFTENIFLLVRPAFELFDKLLDGVIAKEPDIGQYDKIYKTIDMFIDSVNSVMSHSLATGQTDFIIPGYSIIPFTVPVKLVMLYAWLINKVGIILNDCSCEYKCLLTPDMESRAKTSLLDFGFRNENRLILVKLSNRSLYYPNYLFIILTHEMAHYIGTRKRELRADCIIRTVSYSLAEVIVPFDMTLDGSGQLPIVFDEIKKSIASRIRRKGYEYLCDELKKSSNDSKYFSYELQRLLTKKCRRFIFDLSNGMFDALLLEIYKEIKNKYGTNYLYIFNMLCKKSRHNIMCCLVNDSFCEVINSIFIAYKEVYSDIVAHALIKFRSESFSEAFNLSEGMNIGDNDKSNLQKIRERVIKIISGEILENKSSLIKSSSNKIDYKNYGISEKIYSFIWFENILMNYIKECYQDIQNRVKEDNVRDIVENIRNMYNLFVLNKNDSCSEVIYNIFTRINDYGN